MAMDLNETELRAWRSFLRTHSHVIRVLDAELAAERGLSLSTYEILLVLAHSPGRAVRMSDLAGEMLLTRSGMTRAIDQLQAKGLVERRPCPSDGRGYLAALTEEGYDELKRAAPIHVRGVREHFTSRLDATQLDTLACALEQIGVAEAPSVEP